MQAEFWDLPVLIITKITVKELHFTTKSTPKNHPFITTFQIEENENIKVTDHQKEFQMNAMPSLNRKQTEP